MGIRILCVCLLQLALVCPMEGKSIREIWLSLPDTIVPYIDKAQRTEMIDLLSKVKNRLEEDSHIDTLMSDFISVRLNEACRIQIKRLPVIQGDSLLCLIQTYYGTEPDSKVMLYKQDWQFFDELRFSASELLQRPDSMSIEQYDELVLLLDPCLLSASWQTETDELHLSVSAPFLTEEEKQSLSALFLQRKLKWTGEKFK